MKGEELTLEKELAMAELGTPPAQDGSAPPPPPESTLEDLLAEMGATAFAGLAFDHASALLRTWALRWRIFLERLGPRGRDDRRIRLAYARIREAKKVYPRPLPYLPALRPDSSGDWAGELDSALTELQRLGLRPERVPAPRHTDWGPKPRQPWQEDLLGIAAQFKIDLPAEECA